MAKDKKPAQPIPKAYVNAKHDARNFEMHPTDAKWFWGFLGAAGLAASIFMIVLLIIGRVKNVNMIIFWIILMIGLPALGYITNKEFFYQIKNKQIIRKCIMMKDRAVNLTDIQYYEEKTGRNPNVSYLYLHYANRGRKVYMKIPSTYTNFDLMQQVVNTYKWKKRAKL